MEKIGFNTSEQFEDLLGNLSHPVKSQDVEELLLPFSDRINSFKVSSWARGQLAETFQGDDCTLTAAFVLLVFYRLSVLLKEALANKMVKKREDVIFFLVLAKYLWPAYLLWIRQEGGLVKPLSPTDAASWLSGSTQFTDALQCMGIGEDPRLILNSMERELNKGYLTLYRLIKAGVEILHHNICDALGVVPSEKTKKSEKSPGSENEQFELPIVKAAKPDWEPNGEELLELNRICQSPFLQRYPGSRFMDLLSQSQVDRCLLSWSRFIDSRLEKGTAGPELTSDQRVMAKELLYSLPDWMLVAETGGRSIPRHLVEMRWNGFHRQDVSLVLSALLNSGLLRSQGTKICFRDDYVYDYLLARRDASRGNLCPQPPDHAGVHLSQWIWLLCLQYCETGSFETAGQVLKSVQMDLPGFASGSWGQIALILLNLPPAFLNNRWAWIFASIAAGIGKRVISDGGLPNVNEMHQLGGRLPALPSESASLAQDCVAEYFNGLDMLGIFMEDKVNDEDAEGDIAQKILSAINGLGKWEMKKQAYSVLRRIDPDLPIRTLFSLKKPLMEVLRSKFQGSEDVEAQAIAETLFMMGDKDAVLRLKSMGPEGYSHRVGILVGARKSLLGYEDWV